MGSVSGGAPCSLGHPDCRGPGAAVSPQEGAAVGASLVRGLAKYDPEPRGVGSDGGCPMGFPPPCPQEPRGVWTEGSRQGRGGYPGCPFSPFPLCATSQPSPTALALEGTPVSQPLRQGDVPARQQDIPAQPGNRDEGVGAVETGEVGAPQHCLRGSYLLLGSPSWPPIPCLPAHSFC